VARFLQLLLSNCSHCSLLRPLVLSSSLIGCQSVQVYPHHPAFPLGGSKSSESSQCSYISGFYPVCSLFFRFGGGQPLHNVLTFIFHSLIKVPTVFFTTSSSTVCLKVLLSVVLLPRCNRPFRPQFLMPLLYSGCARHLFLNVFSRFLLQHCPFQVPDKCVPCTVQEWHGVSSLCGWRPTSGSHHRPGFVPSVVGSTVWLDAGPHTAPSVL
jgi:hypothetical protein